MKRRILSMILAIAMVVSLFAGLSITASAVDAPADGSYVIAANVNGTYYAMADIFGSKIGTAVVTVTDGTVSEADAEGFTVTLTNTADGYTISNGDAYLAYNSSTNFKSVDTLESAAYWNITDGVKGTYRIANAATPTRGVVFRASTYNQFGAYAVSNVTENGTEYYDVELLTVEAGVVWNWDGNPGANGYHTEVNQYNETRQVACTRGQGTIVPPTCIATGLATYYCRVCDAEIETVVLDYAPHNYVNGVCTVCGAAQPQYDTFILADSLRVGDDIIFVDETGAKAAGPLGGNGSSTYLTAVDATISDGTAQSENALVFTVEEGSAPGTYNFKTDGTWLTASKASSSNNYLYLTEDDETPEDLDWTVTFTDGLAAVSYCSSLAANGRYLRYNVNNGNPRFSGYTSSSSSIRNVSIYKRATGQDLVDVYFVDQDDNAEAYAYAYGQEIENSSFPGEQLTALGVDENGDNYYKITLDRIDYTNVIFSGGNSNTQTGNLSLGSGSYIVYYVNNHVAYEGDDVWPGPGTVIAPTCTEDGCTRYVGLLTGAVHEIDVTEAIGHVWGAWTFNGDNTHTRVCANDATHTETDYCVDEDEDGICDVCGSELVAVTGLVTPGAYVIAAKIGDVYYALPNAMSANNPDGEVITVVDGTVSADDAEDYVFNLKLLLNGAYTIDNGESYLGGGASGTSLHGLSMEDELTDFYRWNITAGEFGSYRITNAAVTNRGLIYQDNSSANPTTAYNRFGLYVTGNVNGETFFDIELLPVAYLEPESPEEIDIWFVDETDSASAYAYYFNADAASDPLDTHEDLQFPGRLLNSLGYEKNGHKYYKITLGTDEYTHVIFNNGQTGGVESGNQTIDLNFKADAMTNPLDSEANRYVVYYIYRDGDLMEASVGTDVWPAPGVVTEPTCTEPGITTYTGLVTGAPVTGDPVEPLGHDYAAVVTEPTCTAAGFTTYTCSRCGDTYTADETPALGHSYGAPVWDWTGGPGENEGELVKTGVTQYTVTATFTCSRCGVEQVLNATVTNETIPATDDDPEMIVYTATVEFEGETYTDTKIEEVTPVGPVEPIETTNLHIYSSISVGTDMVITFTARKTDLTNYSKFWIQVVKHAAEGDETYLYGAEQAEALDEGTASWRADFKHIYAKEMGLNIEARLFAEDAEGQIYMSPALTTNIRDYLGGRLTATNNKVTQRTLAADMLNYGAAAQLFMNYETEHLVNQELTSAQLAKLHQYETTTLPTVAKTNTNTVPTGQSTILYNSVTLGNEVLLTLAVRAAADADVKVLVKDHTTGTVLYTLDTAYSGSSHKVDFNGIGADKMRVEYDFVAQINGAETGNIRTWSIEGYVGEIRNGNNQLKTNLANALLTYGDAAAAYFAS